MNRRGWWAVDWAAALLDPVEREAVRGDLIESSDSAGRALRQVLGLVVRRQWGLWHDWRPWAALSGLAIPFGAMLGFQAAMMGRTYDLYLWIGRNYGEIDRGLLRATGLEPMRAVAMIAGRSVLLLAVGWTAGFALGSLSRRAVWLNGALFAGMVLAANFLGTSRFRYQVNGEEFMAISMWAALLPLVSMLLLVLVPAVWGMRVGARRIAISLPAALLWTAAMVVLNLAVPRVPRWWWNWPIVYVLATAWLRRERREA